eukprot:gnl/MRDRNA2_/MRDRNA2_189004_c0_seq1.p1 gnl/MRDRNA2_/MRDRNA2_189004_c0~~gnl/MRDRNA2_/MRDRNA2_189004_c0_seq1.p1  ORF type:complete len:238 (+),score=21.84 gnl/MRDRNA2_/MRDRNA2_189004_c0_seq1:55-768(+)
MASGCEVLPGLFGILVQGILFLCRIGTLVFKKYREKSERTWFEFGLDSSKQLAGAGWIHVLNIVFAQRLESNLAKGDECEWYWVNIMVDTTLGVYVSYVLLHQLTAMVQALFGERGGDDFKSGSYKDSQGDIIYDKFYKQLVLWLVVVTGMKVFMLVLMLLFSGPLGALASFVLTPVSWHSGLKLVSVMIVTPFAMNSLQFWLVDNIIRKQPGPDSTDPCEQQPLVIGHASASTVKT